MNKLKRGTKSLVHLSRLEVCLIHSRRSRARWLWQSSSTPRCGKSGRTGGRQGFQIRFLSCFLIGGTCNFRGQLHALWRNGNKRVFQHTTALVVHLLHLLKGLVNAGHAASTVLLFLTQDKGAWAMWADRIGTALPCTSFFSSTPFCTTDT